MPGGPYCASGTGAASANGNGGANANGNSTSTNGEPCAGCVGSADNKNPPGQMPNASDTNAGYECDHNNGIAKGNPAHTGCTTTSTTTTTTTTSSGPGNSSSAPGQQSETTSVTAVTTAVTPQASVTQAAPATASGVLGATATRQTPAATPKGPKTTVTTLPARHAVAPAAKPVSAQPSFTG